MREAGVRIVEVASESPAEAAGIKSDDVLLALDAGEGIVERHREPALAVLRWERRCCECLSVEARRTGEMCAMETAGS